MYIYVIGAFFFVAIWAVLFAFIPKSRSAILWSSLSLGHAGPISEYWHIRDYWSPIHICAIEIDDWVFGIEDYLFAFAFAGLCAGIFDLLARRVGQEELARFNVSGFVSLMLFGLVCLLAMSALVELFKLNSLYAVVLAFLAAAGLILERHRKWIVPAVETACLVAAVMWIFYWGFFLRLFPGIIDEWWKARTLSGVSLAGVPIEEMAWAWATALFVGPLFRYCTQ